MCERCCEGREEGGIITFSDTLFISSSVVTFLLKLTLMDEVNLKVRVGSRELYSLMESLGLTEKLYVKRLEPSY